MSTQPGRVVCWFSCGIPSAIMASLALKKYGPAVEVVYCDTSKDEHADNARFSSEVERWLGIKIKTITGKFRTVDDVFAYHRYMSGVAGAKCTVEMKKKPRFAYQRVDDLQMFGLALDEMSRVRTFTKNNPELRLEWPLVDAALSREDCHRIMREAGILPPMMYRLGFNNNNCIGCVKAQSPAYWNKVRRHFPVIFELRAKRSRELKCRLIKIKGVRSYLDELPQDCEEEIKEDLTCGPQCASTNSNPETP